MQFAKLTVPPILGVIVAACNAPLHPETPPLLKWASVGQEYLSHAHGALPFAAKMQSYQSLMRY
jgi:hypothetical protein